MTLSVARKLYQRLEADPMFKPAMTRDGDYFISVSGRSDVARKKGANMLVSIHADSARIAVHGAHQYGYCLIGVQTVNWVVGWNNVKTIGIIRWGG